MRLGEYDTQGNPDCIQENEGYDCADESLEYEVERTIVHDQYEEGSQSQHHDIALLKTKLPIKYSIYVAPICIPTEKLTADVVIGKRMTLAGWGTTDRCKRLVIHNTFVLVIKNSSLQSRIALATSSAR